MVAAPKLALLASALLMVFFVFGGPFLANAQSVALPHNSHSASTVLAIGVESSLSSGGVNATILLNLFYILIVVSFISVPLVYGIGRAYRAKRDSKDLLYEMLRTLPEKLTPEERMALIKQVEAPPPSLVGFTRSLVALTILLILGIALFSALLLGIAPGTERVVDVVLGALVATVAAISGFYFGGKLGEEAAEKAKKEAEETRGKGPKGQGRDGGDHQ